MCINIYTKFLRSDLCSGVNALPCHLLFGALRAIISSGAGVYVESSAAEVLPWEEGYDADCFIFLGLGSILSHFCLLTCSTPLFFSPSVCKSILHLNLLHVACFT